ncbi:MAG: hypothetical protein K2P92_03265 [Bdellovibrionaceae bacterium]|nr:hypothetical protein [Pseudobdellovibrionaceae bacterium]
MAAFSYNYFISAAHSDMRGQYQDGLASALSRFGVDQVVLKTVEKKSNEDTFVVLATSSAGHELGGIRIEIKTPENRLPLEKCATKFQTTIQMKIDQYVQQNYIVAEICGLWASPLAKGTGLGADLALQSTQLALDLGADVVVSMLPSHTLGYFTRLGFVTDRDIPVLTYPDDRYLSTVVWYLNPQPKQMKYVENQFNLEV